MTDQIDRDDVVIECGACGVRWPRSLGSGCQNPGCSWHGKASRARVVPAGSPTLPGQVNFLEGDEQ